MEAYVTLVTSDSYVPGALVLGHRLRDLRTTRPLACLITPGIADHLRELLANVYDELIDVDPLETTTPENLQFLGRPDLGLTFTKLHLWRLSRRKLVFLDADTLPLRNVDELFQRPSFSAAPDAGWPDCFNSGVFVMEPSEVCYRELVALAAKQGSFDGGDQGLLNSYFSSWPETIEHRLPFIYNVTSSTTYSYVPAYLRFRDKIAIVHFIGQPKPWHIQRFADGSVFCPGSDLIQVWWDTWDARYGKISPASLIAGTRTNNAGTNSFEIAAPDKEKTIELGSCEGMLLPKKQAVHDHRANDTVNNGGGHEHKKSVKSLVLPGRMRDQSSPVQARAFAQSSAVTEATALEFELAHRSISQQLKSSV